LLIFSFVHAQYNIKLVISEFFLSVYNLHHALSYQIVLYLAQKA